MPECCLECSVHCMQSRCCKLTAINYIVNETVAQQVESGQIKNIRFMEINEKKIIPLYDPPHLIKGVRNNLFTRNLVWKQPGGTLLTANSGVMSNKHKIDNVSGELRALPKLTEAHVNLQKNLKIKVACATQVMSHSVASVIALLARSGTEKLDGTKLEIRASDTALLFHLWDKVFDGVNGH